MVQKTRFTEEQIVKFLQEAGAGHDTIEAFCRKHGVASHTFYIWRRKYAGMQKDDVHQLRELERENMQLKKLLAERDLEIDAIEALFRKQMATNTWEHTSITSRHFATASRTRLCH
jgi:putative transposase